MTERTKRSITARHPGVPRGVGEHGRLARIVLRTALTLGLLAGAGVTALAQDGAPGSLPVGRLAVVGEGRVAAIPDMGEISLAIVRDAPNAGDALARTAAAAADVLATMQELGIEPRDVQTTDVSLNPVYGETERSRDTPPVIGYSARNAFTVRVRDLDRLGEVIDRSVAMGANEGGGLRLTVSNADELRDEARRLAVRAAAARAADMAEAAGVTLGPIVSLGEGGAQAFPMPVGRMAMSAEAMPIAAGEMEITASVQAVYAIGEAE